MLYNTLTKKLTFVRQSTRKSTAVTYSKNNLPTVPNVHFHIKKKTNKQMNYCYTSDYQFEG